jgi:hypothetical protein
MNQILSYQLLRMIHFAAITVISWYNKVKLILYNLLDNKG